MGASPNSLNYSQRLRPLLSRYFPQIASTFADHALGAPHISWRDREVASRAQLQTLDYRVKAIDERCCNNAHTPRQTPLIASCKIGRCWRREILAATNSVRTHTTAQTNGMISHKTTRAHTLGE